SNRPKQVGALLSATGRQRCGVVVASLQLIACNALQRSTAALAATCNEATRSPAGRSSVLVISPCAGSLLLLPARTRLLPAARFVGSPTSRCAGDNETKLRLTV